MANRRSVLIGLGGLVAAGGAALGTGAFTTVEAQRTVTIDTAGDADAFLGLQVRDDLDATSDDGLVELDLSSAANASGLNRNARTVLEKVLLVQNNGTQDGVDIEFTVDEIAANEATVTTGSGAEEIFNFSEDSTGTFDDGGDGIELDGTSLDSGQATAYDLEIELRSDEISSDNSSATDVIDEIDSDNAAFDVTVTITATSDTE